MMATFKGTIRGRRGSCSRLGDGNTGMFARIDATFIGVVVEAHYDDRGRGLVFEVYKTGGRKSSDKVSHVCTITDFPQDLEFRTRH